MVNSDNEFNPQLWDERFANMKSSVQKIEKTVSDLSKLMILAIVGITGWALVQLYAELTMKANASIVHTPISAIFSKK